MSALYGSLVGASPLEVTRRGHSHIEAYVRSWNFGIRTSLRYDHARSLRTENVWSASIQLTGGSGVPIIYACLELSSLDVQQAANGGKLIWTPGPTQLPE